MAARMSADSFAANGSVHIFLRVARMSADSCVANALFNIQADSRLSITSIEGLVHFVVQLCHTVTHILSNAIG